MIFQANNIIEQQKFESMKVNKDGIFDNVNYWKLGSNWEKNNQSFFNVLKEHNIVISFDPKAKYNVGDFVLISERYKVIAIACVLKNAEPIAKNESVIKQLKKYKVNDFENISYYKSDIYELPKEKQFEYKLQQGVGKIHQNSIKIEATNNWLNRNTSSFMDKRIMRITWNEFNWEKPSGHKWRAKDQGKNSVAHENQYGYGHEEWLLNSVFHVNGYQYGFIQGVDKMSTEVEIIDELYLFTIKPKTSERLLVAKIKNVKIIEGIDEEINFIQPYVDGNKKQMIEDLISVNAYYERFNELPHKPNVKFRLEDANFYTPPIAIPQLNQGENRYKYNRFQPYQIDESLSGILTEKQNLASRFNFEAGKASSSINYNKQTKSTSTTVTRTHSKITDVLYEYLLKTEQIAEEKISVEKTRIGGAIADVVVEENENLYSIFEVKTKASAILNIREAIGQIFEYAFLDQSINIEKLVIVGPAACNSQELKYLEKLKSMIKVRIEYWAYKETAIKNSFIKQ